MFGKSVQDKKGMELLRNMVEGKDWTIERFSLRLIKVETG